MKEQSSTPNPREKQLRDLAVAYDSFMDLKNNIEEGTQVWLWHQQLNNQSLDSVASITWRPSTLTCDLDLLSLT